MKTVTLFGPTASGKSALAVGLAQALGGEIINADSRQVYRHLPLITACPSAADYAAVPHHLFENIELGERYTAGRYAAEAAQKIAEVQGRGRLPIVVGGTGFYLKTLMMNGSANAPEVSGLVAETLKKELETSGLEALWQRLRARDPEAAAGIKPGDTQRVLRALGVVETTGEKFSGFKNDGAASGDYLCLALNPPRDELVARIERRWQAMQDAGVVDEVKAAWASTPHEAPGLQSVGAREIGAFLDGELSWEKAEANYLTAMRQYAKRQRTWLRNSYPAAVVWENGEDVAGAVVAVKRFDDR